MNMAFYFKDNSITSIVIGQPSFSEAPHFPLPDIATFSMCVVCTLDQTSTLSQRQNDPESFHGIAFPTGDYTYVLSRWRSV